MDNSKIHVCPWDLSSYHGRWKYYSWIFNPKLNFTSTATIEEAKQLRLSYSRGVISKDVTEERILYAKQIYENVFHPDTAQVQNTLGRMSFMPIGKALLFSTLLSQFTNSTTPSYFWHGLNQSYDSFVNYTNRNGDTKLDKFRLGVSYFAATISSTLAAYYTEKYLTSKIRHPFLFRFIPFSTFLVASTINVPLMRHNEIVEGVGIYDCNKEKIGYSRIAAAKGIGETIITRIVTFMPVLFFSQYLVDILENKSCWFRKNKWTHFPVRFFWCGLLLIGMLPVSCAIFPQFSPIETNIIKKFDEQAFCQIVENCPKIPDQVYFNKGL